MKLVVILSSYAMWCLPSYHFSLSGEFSFGSGPKDFESLQVLEEGISFTGSSRNEPMLYATMVKAFSPAKRLNPVISMLTCTGYVRPNQMGKPENSYVCVSFGKLKNFLLYL